MKAEVFITGAHIFTADAQPATDWWDRHIDPPMRLQCSPRTRRHCWDCGRVREAKNMVVFSHYDSTRYSCREGHRWDGRRRRFVTESTPCMSKEEKP